MKRDASVCPISRTLDVLGDKWSLLVIRDLFAGKRHYKEFLSSPEAISTNILAARLKKLVDAGIVSRGESNESPPRPVYDLTDSGRDLYPVLDAMAGWGLRYIEGTEKRICIEP